MITRTILIGAVAAAFLGLAERSPSARIRFAPSDGASVTKTFENEVTLTLDRFTVGGLGAAQTPEMESTRTTSQKVVVTDTYVRTQGGAPVVLARAYDELGARMESTMKQTLMGQTNTSEQNMRAKSALEGHKVVFTWNAETHTFDKAFDPEEEKPELLRGLVEDMDLRGFLPKGEVAEGESWELEPKTLLALFLPGGDLSLVPENVDPKSLRLGGAMDSMMGTIGDSLQGTAEARLVSVSEIEGSTCAKIRLTLRVHSKADMLDATRRALAESDLPPEAKGLEFEKNDVSFAFEGEGELVWDLKAGHFRSLEITGQNSVETLQVMTIDAAGRPMKIEQSQEMSGTARYTARAR